MGIVPRKIRKDIEDLPFQSKLLISLQNYRN